MQLEKKEGTVCATGWGQNLGHEGEGVQGSVQEGWGLGVKALEPDGWKGGAWAQELVQQEGLGQQALGGNWAKEERLGAVVGYPGERRLGRVALEQTEQHEGPH